MPERNFVLLIDKKAFAVSVRNIGEKLQELAHRGIEPTTREYDSLLKDVMLGVRDNLLLKTELEPMRAEQLLSETIGKDFKYCTIQWLHAAT